MRTTAAKPKGTRKWVLLGATLATMAAGTIAFSERPTPCYEAYVMSGLTEQQMSREEFRELYGYTVCASERQHA